MKQCPRRPPYTSCGGFHVSTLCILSDWVFFLPALDFFLPAFGVTREKDARLRRCFCASTIVGGNFKKPARPRRCFLASAYGAKKGRGPEKVRFCQGMGVFFCQRICRRAQVRGEMRLRKGVPVPCEGEKTQRKINFETWVLRENLHNPALQHREVSSVDRSLENPKLEGGSGGAAGKFLRSTSSVSSTCQIQHCDAEIEWVVPSTIQHSQKQNV